MMYAWLWAVLSCSTTPTMTVTAPTRNTPLRPRKSLSGAAVSEPTSSPTLIMDVMTDRSADLIS